MLDTGTRGSVSICKESSPRWPESWVASLANGPTHLAESSTKAIDFRAAGTWHVAHVHGGKEQLFASKVAADDIVSYVPSELVSVLVRRRERGREGEQRRIVRPRIFFSAYAFFAGGADAIYAAKSTGLVWGVIPVARQEKLIVQLQAFDEVFRAGKIAKIHPELITGVECRVKIGRPFAMREGILSRKDDRFYLPIFTLGQMCETEISPDDIEPI